MKRPFQVDDRVACYSADENGRQVGTVSRVDLRGNLKVEIVGDTNVWYHPKQCRRIVRKERRELWVNPECLCSDGWIENYKVVLRKAEVPGSGWIRFVEAREKK